MSILWLVDDLRTRSAAGLAPGVAAAVVGVALALVAHRLVPALGVLTWAVLLGVLVANAGAVPDACRPGLRAVTRRLLRVGVVLLGFSLSLVTIAALGVPMVALVVVTLLTTLVGTTWLGRAAGLSPARSLLLGTGIAICGASAIAAMEENAEADADDVAVSIAMITLYGTVAMIALPLLQAPLGLSAEAYGAWAGASVHEVGQVVAAAGPAGSAALGVAVVVKLTRVLMLAPVVAGVSLLHRRRAARGETVAGARLPPLVPAFVVAFLACVALRTAGLVPQAWLGPIATVQTAVLAAALFGMGTQVRVRDLAAGSRSAAAVACVASLAVAGFALAGVAICF